MKTSISHKIIHESRSFTRLVDSAAGRRPFHAYLLTGDSVPTLVAFARAFASWLHCQSSEEVSCGECRNCLLHRHSSHPALHWIRPQGNEISISDIRSIVEASDYKASAGLHRVFIVEQADTMTIEGANAFLKTLEEPPGKAVFILTTNRRHAMLGTIVSRCMTIEVRLPSPETIVEDFLDSSSYPAPMAYLALLLSRTDLGMIDFLASPGASGQSPCHSTNDDTTSLGGALSKFLEHANAPLLLEASSPFTSRPEYPLLMFGRLCDFLAHDNSPMEAMELALEIDDADKIIEKAVKRHFDALDKDLEKTYGRSGRSIAPDSLSRKRRVRRLTTQHKLLLLDCLQTALRLALVLDGSGQGLPYGLEQEFPSIERLSIDHRYSITVFRDLVVSTRERLFSNVGERALFTDFFLSLQEAFDYAVPCQEGVSRI